MLSHFAQLNPRKIAILIMLALIALRLGWSVIDPYLNRATADTESCQQIAEGIRDGLNKANHCDTNEDCTSAKLACPFHCNTYINAKTDLAAVRQNIQKYQEQCGFCVEECLQAKPVCVNHHCMSFETLPVKDYAP